MMRIVIIALLIFISSFGNTQEIIKGSVFNASTSEPLGGAVIYVGKNYTITDSTGFFTIKTSSNIKSVIVSMVGFETIRLSKNDFNKEAKIFLEPEATNLQEVIVTGFESKRSLLNSTGSIAIANSRDFDRADKSSLANMINQIPGVQARGPNILRPATISIRGMGARGPGATGRIKIYLNDLMLTNADGTNAWEDIDPYTIGSIEVIKGPASSIYGASVGGVLNISTQKAKANEESIEYFGMAGDFETWRNGATYRLNNSRVNIMATLGTQRTNGFRDFSNEQRSFGTFLATLKGGDKSTTTLFFNRNQFDSRAPGTLTPNQTESNPTQALPLSRQMNAGRDITFTRIGVSHDWKLSERIRNITSITTAFSDLDHPIQGIYIFQLTQNAGVRSRFLYDTYLGSKKLTLTAGFEYQVGVVRTNFYRNLIGRPDSVRIGDRQSKVRNGIVFTQAELELSRKLLVTVGLSANYYQYSNLEFTLRNTQEQLRRFTPFYAPRVAFNYKLSNKVAVHGNVSRGFTPPSTGDINRPDGSINNNLRPETAWNYEVGARGKMLNGWLEFDASIYRLNLADEILTRTPQIGFSIRENAGSTSYTGFELSLQSNLMRNQNSLITKIIPQIGYTRQRTIFENFTESFTQSGNIIQNRLNGNWVPGNAPNRIFSNINIASRNGFYGFINYEWVDLVYVNNQNTLKTEPFSLLGAKTGWRGYISNTIELNAYVGVNNALNAIYTDAPALNPNPIATGPLAGQFPFMNVNWGRQGYGGIDLKIHLKKSK